MRETEFLFQQGFALRARPGVTLDRAAHPLSGQCIGVGLAFNQDEASRAAVFGVGFVHRVSGGAGAGEGVENSRVIHTSDIHHALDQISWLWRIKYISAIKHCPKFGLGLSHRI